MAKRHNPSTSTDAYHSVRDHVIPSHHQKILEALQKNGEGIYEEIAVWCGFSDKNRVSRRLLELEKEPPHGRGLIEKTGATKSTSTGRKAFIYRLKPNILIIDSTNCCETVVSPHPKSAQKQSFQPSLF